MSPSEHELRAALSDGEGSGLNVDRVISNALEYRRQRRARIYGGVSIAALVAGIGVASGVLIGHSSNDSSATDKAAAGGNAYASAPVPSAAGAGANASRATTDCPATVPTFGASAPRASKPASAAKGALFPTPPQTVVVCAYRALDLVHTAATPGRAELSGAQASALVNSLENAPTSLQGACPDYRTTRAPQSYVIFGVETTGAPSAPVVAKVADNPCQTVVTNGSATRYQWTPPNGLASILAGLIPPSTHS